MSSWQPIATVPFCADDVLVWVSSSEEAGDGWVKIGTIAHLDPIAIIDEDGCEYWPHENGGYPTHWMPLPAAPSVADERVKHALQLLEICERLWSSHDEKPAKRTRQPEQALAS